MEQGGEEVKVWRVIAAILRAARDPTGRARRLALGVLLVRARAHEDPHLRLVAAVTAQDALALVGAPPSRSMPGGRRGRSGGDRAGLRGPWSQRGRPQQTTAPPTLRAQLRQPALTAV